ncbi:hypothetical protein D3C87_1650140 [compost metagenome]
MFQGELLYCLADKLLYDAATEIGQGQNASACDVKPDDATTAPALVIMSPQQDNINKPRDDREHGFIDVLNAE